MVKTPYKGSKGDYIVSFLKGSYRLYTRSFDHNSRDLGIELLEARCFGDLFEL